MIGWFLPGPRTNVKRVQEILRISLATKQWASQRAEAFIAKPKGIKKKGWGEEKDKGKAKRKKVCVWGWGGGWGGERTLQKHKDTMFTVHLRPEYTHAYLERNPIFVAIGETGCGRIFSRIEGGLLLSIESML